MNRKRKLKPTGYTVDLFDGEIERFVEVPDRFRNIGIHTV